MNEHAHRVLEELNTQLVRDYEKDPSRYQPTERAAFRAYWELVLGMNVFEVSDALDWHRGNGFSSYFYDSDPKKKKNPEDLKIDVGKIRNIQVTPKLTKVGESSTTTCLEVHAQIFNEEAHRWDPKTTRWYAWELSEYLEKKSFKKKPPVRG